jgi:hypothetical protein
MSYFIFSNNSDGVEGTLYRIAENESDLNNSHIDKTSYKIIEDSQENFEAVKYNLKNVVKYNDNNIIYSDVSNSHTKNDLINYVNSFKSSIQAFLKFNEKHSLFNLWNDYYNQLNSLNLDSITYPLNKSLEQYFKDLGQPSLHPLQLP